MGSKSVASIALILVSLNLLFFSMVSSDTVAPAGVDGAQYDKCPDLRHCIDISVPTYKAVGYCCATIKYLDDLSAAQCLCLTIKSNVGGIYRTRPTLVQDMILNSCGRPTYGYACV